MSDSTQRKYQSGREVLEEFVPGYIPPRPVLEEDAIKRRRKQSPEELKNELLASLKAKLEQLKLKR